MSVKLTITLDQDMFDFVCAQAAGNRSAFVNRILKQAYSRWFKAELKRGLLEDASDPEYQAEIALWDACVADGLEDEDEEDWEEPGVQAV